MTDTKPEIPQETVAKAAEAAWLALQTGGCTAEKIALACLEAAGVGELIAEQEAKRQSLAQEITEGLRVRGHWAPSDASADVITAVFLALDKAARPSRETVDKLVEALFKIQHLRSDYPMRDAREIARAALSAYESETKREPRIVSCADEDCIGCEGMHVLPAEAPGETKR